MLRLNGYHSVRNMYKALIIEYIIISKLLNITPVTVINSLLLLSLLYFLVFHRGCDQLQLAIRRLGPQHGNLRHDQQLRGRVCVNVCVCVSVIYSIRNKLVLWRIHACDCRKFSDYRPRDAVRAIKKRIVGNKNFKEVMLALTVSVFPSPVLCSPTFLLIQFMSNCCCTIYLFCCCSTYLGPGDLCEELWL